MLHRFSPKIILKENFALAQSISKVYQSYRDALQFPVSGQRKQESTQNLKLRYLLLQDCMLLLGLSCGRGLLYDVFVRNSHVFKRKWPECVEL